jgi:23S rRNA (cytidine2498-2'-O)-methyltransferase
VWERDIDVPVDEQDQAVRGTRAAQVEAELRARGAFADDVRARAGERVVDVIVPHASEPDEPWLVGAHVHDAGHGPWPGGVPHVAPPPEAPSRAWCKIEEALRWADLEPAAGEIAVELGSSPGGASYAMLVRGLEVHGVDPGAMDPRVLAFDRFHHHHVPAAEVQRKDLPRRYQWLLNDINLAPMVALKYVERFVALAHGGLRGAVLTLKLNDDGVFAALPRLLERIGKLGAARVRVTQLPSHRSEVVAILTW